MRVGVWGAGRVGSAVAYRLATMTFVSELFWINRQACKIDCRCVDIEHGLAFAPSCRSIIACSQKNAAPVIAKLELLILSLGVAVRPGGRREDLYAQNASVYRQAVIPLLKGSFGGILIVVTNPVDLMARLVAVEGEMRPQRVLGLGTVVETARLRASLSGYLVAVTPPREISAYAVGTHDQRFEPVLAPGATMGESLDQAEIDGIREAVRREVAAGAERVKQDEGSTIHPIVEGVVAVARAVANDALSILTVSTLDPLDPDQLFFSLPCQVGRDGVSHRYTELLEAEPVRTQLRDGVEALRGVLRASL